MKKNLGARLAVCPVPIYLVSVYDSENKPNVMTVGWCGVCCSRPPCLSISVRRETHTYKGLVAHMAFTANLPTTRHAAAVSCCGRTTGRKVSKFERTGLTPVPSEFVDAPYIEEMPINLECRIIQIHEIGSHVQFIGEIVNTRISTDFDESVPLIEQGDPFIVYGTGNDFKYYPIGSPIEFENI
ncbi:MAG: flavin reductase family protein [Desulfovibrionaceae bacterium]|nr:flavin reductase family protein [Desulfovibrionaceae bacterium]